MQPQALPGFRDFYPAELALRDHLFRTWRQLAARYGFEEYDGPPLEPLELYTAKSGQEIVGQLYSFTDKGGREVSLRPEMTPTLARMVAARATVFKKPIRWFSIPQLFRYERQQRGRLREHFQLNCDLIGESGPLADAEIIALAIDAVRTFGLGPGDIRVRVSDRRLLSAMLSGLGIGEAERPLVYQVFDKIRRAPEATSVARLAEADVSSATIDRLLQLTRVRSWTELEGLGDGLDSALRQGDGLRQAIAGLSAMGFGEYLDLDLGIVRGLAYYTGTVFELFDAGGELRAICGGGRYDNLLQSLGGVDLPALGFGMGDVVLGELLRDRGLAPNAPAGIEVFVAGITPDDVPHVLALARELREASFRVEYALSPQAVGKQLQLAGARRAGYAVVVGPDDRARGEVMLKDLRGKDQSAIARGELLGRLTSLLR